MVLCQCLKNFFGLSNSTLCPSLGHYDIISFIVVSLILTLTGDSQYFKLGGGVLYHPSTGWVSIACRQDPSHSDDDVTQYMWHDPLQYMASSLSQITSVSVHLICFYLS